ncbi:hypothetical protein A2U01_0107880, partial [Trifolium medium]|nr:hypothetical protein [Trifolium medium]
PTLTSESKLLLASEALQLQRLKTSELLKNVPEAEHVHSLDYQSIQYQ